VEVKMPGQSKQEKQGEKLYGDISKYNPNVQNRFNNYENPFEFGDVSSELDSVFGGYEDIINRDTAETIANTQQQAASSLASRGITGGSALTDTKTGIASNINKGKANALSQLGIGKSSALSDLMQYFNQLKFGTTKAASDVDFGNVRNKFGKFSSQGGALSFLDDDTWLDDLFAGFNAAGNVGGGVASIVTASDIRLKENLKKVNQINGINIYEFNYIGNPKRFRGVIAQEVPEASVNIGGVLFVDYPKLGIPFEEV
jgi:hypothetical protein